MRPNAPLLAGALFGLMAIVLLLGSADSARADFNPTLDVTIENPAPEANSNQTVDFNLPSGDVNFGGVVAFVPREVGIVPGDQIPIGAVVGQLTSGATLGLINGACNNALTVEFTFLNSSIDPTDTVPFLDADDNNTPDFVEDKDNSGLPDAFEKYPDFITRVLDDVPGDEVGQPLQPIRRSAGITIVAGVEVLLQFLIFEPGTFINENIPNDEELGFPTVTLLQNAGDPTQDPIPSAITDFCTPLTTNNTSFAISKDNPCTDESVPTDQLDPLCEVTGAVFDIPEVATTTPDESGTVLFTNPQDGTYTFTTLSVGLRDADGDGLENLLDTCAFVANVGDARIGGDGDEDNDGLDAACDPDDSVTNSDEDLDGFLNRQDNCPLDPNGENEDNQRDTDNDQIGDACDPNPDSADTEGELTIVRLTKEVIFGTGEGEGGPPSAEACPNCFVIGGDGGAADGGGDDDGGLSTGAIIGIIIAVIAGVAVVGGGILYATTRRSGGGGASA